MKSKKFLKIIAIVISIIILIIDICLYIKIEYDWTEVDPNNSSYAMAGFIFIELFRVGALLWGILLIPIIWLEYFLTILCMKIYNKFNGIKKILLCLTILIAISIIFILIIGMLLFIIMILIG